MRRVLAITLADIRAGTKRKLPLLLLYLLPAAWMIFACFQVYIQYAAAEGKSALGGSTIQTLALGLKLLEVDIQVRNLISQYELFSRLWVVLVAAWFGAGLLCEDRRRGAHLLYFSRPLTRLGYVVARVATVFFFTGLAVLVPGFVILFVAAWSSPDWHFVINEGEVIFGTLAWGVVTCLFYAVLVLAVSTLASRKLYAMIAVLPVILVPHFLSRVIWRALDDRNWAIISPMTNLGRLGDYFLNVRGFYTWPAWHSTAVIVGIMAACSVIVALRVRRWEVVG